MNRIRYPLPVFNRFSFVIQQKEEKTKLEICSVSQPQNSLFSFKRKQKHEKI